MDLLINTYKFGDRPEVTRPDPAFYKALGEEGIRKMVSRHYDLLRVSSIQGLFPIEDAEFELAKIRSADFMVQICGGPDYFNQHRGSPKLINRHSTFSITPEGRLVWLNCYKQALLELQIPENLILSFWNYVNIFSSWMVNTAPAVNLGSTH
ncbi:MAG TPA: globin [Paludibacter sp.]